VIELPTIRLEMGLQDLGRPNLTPPEQAEPVR
jgi:hypothetical protein